MKLPPPPCAVLPEGSLEVKRPTIWTDEKQRREESEKRREEEGISTKKKPQKKEDTSARKGRKVAIHCVFPMICGSGGSKSRLAKEAGAEPAGQMRQNTPASDHFWKLRCRKSARCWGAKHISKSKCTKHITFEPLLEVAMSKKCMPLWFDPTFGSCDVGKVHAVVARSTCRSQNVQSTTCSRHFWTLKRRFAWQAQGIVHLVRSQQEVRVLWHFPKTMAGVGHLKRICKRSFM